MNSNIFKKFSKHVSELINDANEIIMSIKKSAELHKQILLQDIKSMADLIEQLTELL